MTKTKMQMILIWMTVWIASWPILIVNAVETTSSPTPIESGTNVDEYDSESARKIIGSR